MYEFTLLKSLFFELDKYKIDGVVQTKEGQRTFRRLAVSYESVPQIASITAEERILPYLDRYYFFINDEKVPAELSDPAVKQVIYEFYKEHFPGYLKEGVPEDVTDCNILDCFEPFQMPDYRPKHAFPGLVTLEDIRNGNVHDEDKPKFSFPGLELYADRKRGEGEGAEEEKPMAASFEGYTAFEGDRDQAKSKIEELKGKFAAELAALNVDGILQKATAEEAKEE